MVDINNFIKENGQDPQIFELIESINNNNYYDNFLQNIININQILNENNTNKNYLIDIIDTILHKLRHEKIYFYGEELMSNDDHTKLINNIEEKLYEIKNKIDSMSLYHMPIITNFLFSLSKLIYQNWSSCNVIYLYIKFSKIIHLLILHYDTNLISSNYLPMFYRTNTFGEQKKLDQSYIFSRCYASVKIFDYLFGTTKPNVNTIEGNMLKNKIKILQNVPAYYLQIFISSCIYSKPTGMLQESDFNHTFIIFKYTSDTNIDKYFIFQSYYYEYCPTIKEYNFNQIMNFIDDITSIYYNSNDNTYKSGPWTKIDAAIWEKYFNVNTDSIIGNYTVTLPSDPKKLNNFIKFYPVYVSNNQYEKSYLRYSYNNIDTTRCYDKLKKLIYSSKQFVIDELTNISNQILHFFNIQWKINLQVIIDAIESDRFINIKNNNIYLNTNFNQKKDPSYTLYNGSWDDIRSTLENSMTSQTILDKFTIETPEELYMYIKILSSFFILKRELQIENKCIGSKCNFQVNKNNYLKKYKKYKNKYLNIYK